MMEWDVCERKRIGESALGKALEDWRGAELVRTLVEYLYAGQWHAEYAGHAKY